MRASFTGLNAWCRENIPGCFVGHISPEAADGGPLALVRDGDQITIDVSEDMQSLFHRQTRVRFWNNP